MAVLTVEEILDQLQEIADVADSEARELTADEVAQIEALEADLTAAKERRDRSAAARERIANARKIVTPALHVKGRPDENRDTLEAAFTAYLRTGKENADIEQLRNAQSEGTGSEGGFLVPDGVRSKLVDRMKAFGGLANVVDEIVTETGNSITWPTVDDTSNVGEVVDEGGTFVGGADIVIGEASLGAYSYMAGGAGGLPLRLPRELVQDAAIDVVKLVSGKLGQRAARIQAQHFVRGTGVKQPQGIVTGRTGTGLFTGTSDALVYADFLKAIHDVDPAYREGNCRWAFNDGFLEIARGVMDLNGRPIVKGANDSAATGPGGETILGYPVTIDQSFADAAPTSATVNFGVFGDLTEGYVIRRVREIELLVNPYSRMANRQIEYSCWLRADAVQQNTAAYVALTGTAG